MLSRYGWGPRRERLVDKAGGFGTYLAFLHEWADPQATLRSHELLAQRVMPHFQGHRAAGQDAARRAAEARTALRRMLAMSGGDDYELAFTAPAASRDAVEHAGQAGTR